MAKPRILFLAPRLPVPADTGGKIRTSNILKQLAKDSEIHLVCFSFERNDEDEAQALRKAGITVTLVAARIFTFSEKIIHAFFGSMPFSIVKYNSLNMRNALVKVSRSQEFSAVHIDHLHMALYGDCFGNTPCFIDEHNVEYKILERCAAIEPSRIRRALFLSQAKKMKAFEVEYTRKAAACFTVSEDDKHVLENAAERQIPVHVIPNGVDTGYFSPQNLQEEEESLVFTGSLDWLPNEDAVLYFCKEILPLIRKEKPELKFYIIGKAPTETLRRLAKNDSRITVTGRVDDVRPYMAKSKIFVVPLRIGGGTRLKILEAMAMGKAVVSTSLGAEGIAYAKDKNIILADTPDAFAEKVISLLREEKRRKEIGVAARNLVLGQYDWNTIGEKLNTVYSESAYVQR